MMKLNLLFIPDHEHGLYVYAKPNACDSQTVLKYIGRYLGRPVIATSRIDKYDGETVTFYYNRHEDDKYIEETIPALDFIKRLIRHIPEKHFKMIRYSGLYAKAMSKSRGKLPGQSCCINQKFRDSIKETVLFF